MRRIGIAALLAATFVIISGSASMADLYAISGAATPNQSLTHVYLATRFANGTVDIDRLPDMTAGLANAIIATAEGPGNEDATNYRIVGLYSRNNVTISVNPNLTFFILGQDFETITNAQYYEQQLADALWNDDVAQLKYFAETYNQGAQSVGAASDLISFSAATYGGSTTPILAAPVPEPSSLFALAGGLVSGAGLLRRRLR